MRRSGFETAWITLFSLAGIAGLAGFAPTGGVDRQAASLPSLKNWGLTNSQARSHISAVDAWKISEGSKDIVVAVIDTGLDASHKNLARNVWQDPKAKKGEKVYGFNFVTGKANPADDHGHGTHVAGIIGAVADSQSGVSGVAHHVSIMAVKYYSESNPGSVNLRNTVKAIEYAVENGARIINYSGGGPDFSEEEYLAIKKAEAKGVLFVAAAGNEHQDTDKVENYYYPSAYRLSNIISVAATDINNNLLRSSNWGKSKVDVAAPGENIFSTLPGGRYGYMSGTSQATAFVSGMAALLLSKNPKLTPVELKALISQSVDKLPQLAGKVATNGRVNAYSALLALKARQDGSPAKDGLLAQRPVALLQSLTEPAPASATR
jgi:thermitase